MRRWAVVMVLLMATLILQMHVKIIGIDAAFFLSSKMQMVPIHMKAFQRLFQALPAGTQIQKRPHSHIAADSGITFQI